MKKSIILFAYAISIVSVKAQSAKYTEFMKKNIAMLDSVKTADDLQNSANNFDRIANAEKTQWQPYYYEGYALVMKCFMPKTDPKAIDANCDKADEVLAMAESLSSNNSEINTLKGMVLQARMQADQSRGMTMGPKSTQILMKAVQEDSTNPRAKIMLAQNLFYTPAAFGGSKEKATALVKKAVANYDTFKPATDLDPTWGKEYAVGLLAQWSK